jgi:hypothetical protein
LEQALAQSLAGKDRLVAEHLRIHYFFKIILMLLGNIFSTYALRIRGIIVSFQISGFKVVLFLS